MSESSGEETKYVTVSGNPNLLIGAKKGKEKTKQQAKLTEEEERIKEFESRISPYLSRALEPFYQFVGFLEAESGKRLYYRYDKNASLEQKQNPLITTGKTIQEFKRANAHLGRDFLRFIEETKVKTPKSPAPVVKEETVSNSLIGINIPLYRALINPNANIIEIYAFPAHLWSILPTSTFRFLIGAATFGAIEMAASELGKDLKLLIVSPDVSYMFAQYVCKKFISPKSNAYASGIDGQGGALYRISSGVNTSGLATSKWLMGCKSWFENVYEVTNPIDVHDQKAQAIYASKKPVGFPLRWTSMDDDQLDAFEQRCSPEERDAFQRARGDYLKSVSVPKLYVRSAYSVQSRD